MREYETMFVINPTLDAEATQAVIERFKNLISEQGGEVRNVDEWGRRKLAYEIKDFNEGYYVLMEFAANPDLPAELERVYKITDDIIRYLIILKEDK
ncbi:MAG: small subunit ribosomal protein [Clostridiales bacterium]|jgi:small subunit ribosomal protein S6|nr:small subunit ribosomal protein [Clostridiales bacterium]MDK2992324.1 small subunit ribosomal protein [Clostridiales bacterium]